VGAAKDVLADQGVAEGRPQGAARLGEPVGAAFEQKNLHETVHRILGETGVEPSLIELEITESLLMDDPESAARTLASLKESGVKLSMDDFGTGYSSSAT